MEFRGRRLGVRGGAAKRKGWERDLGVTSALRTDSQPATELEGVSRHLELQADLTGFKILFSAVRPFNICTEQRIVLSSFVPQIFLTPFQTLFRLVSVPARRGGRCLESVRLGHALVLKLYSSLLVSKQTLRLPSRSVRLLLVWMLTRL